MNECIKLANFFKIPEDQKDAILSSDKPSEHLLLALEATNILEPNNVYRLIEAFDELKTNPFCRHVAEIFQKTRLLSYYKEVTEKLGEEMKTLRITTEEEGKELKARWTIHKSPGGRIYHHNSATHESCWENPETSQRAKAHWTIHKSPGGRIYYHNSVTRESCWENPETSQRAKEFAKFSVRVSEKLAKADCVKLATYFNFPSAKIDQVRNDTETPGITLFDILKERDIVNIYDVVRLKEALGELKLNDVNDTLVTPYQRKIDRLRFEERYLSD
ncbi:Pre-mRNA-processing factor 40-like A [Holothuria leucospilota]|uniref:Pre-mRNA-processing factor 40-like A n=1 Tax=Holothuria leucospilota TaxID=206669 RepID=A0A9Q1BXR5_HOLLE|nr:Pre-mRNA-processing factor 40-like A [Holothuria leucospilota]